MNFLSEVEKAQLRIRHKKERDKRVCDRIKAVLLTDEGWTPQQIAKVLFISDQAARDHVEDYKPEFGVYQHENQVDKQIFDEKKTSNGLKAFSK